MKEWNMIHKIKSLYDEGRGLSIKAIAKHLDISKNTVKKYLTMDEASISAYLDDPKRRKVLDDYRDFIIHQLQRFPDLSAVKVQRRLQERCPHLEVSSRSIRRYVNKLKETISTGQQRYYQPVIDMVPGEQCQVDPGELRGVLIGGVETTVYFCVFVLSYSRLMHVSASLKPIDTQKFIEMHDVAFRYFGGVTAECVYDQTKLVVISEIYRELTLNNRFCEYATHAGFRIHACEGYDPESKGKVEAGVKYVKGNALYGEVFQDWPDLEHYLATWVDTEANQRIHATTGEKPQERYDAHERSMMKPYLSPPVIQKALALQTRKADKTGLISYASNKYSVPMEYQSSHVGIRIEDDQLQICDLETQDIVGAHLISQGRGKVIKNSNHYRDVNVKISGLEHDLHEMLGAELGTTLTQLLKKTYPKIYKDQLVAVKKILEKYRSIPLNIVEKCCQRHQLSATLLRDLLEAYELNPESVNHEADEYQNMIVTGALEAYRGLSNGDVS